MNGDCLLLAEKEISCSDVGGDEMKQARGDGRLAGYVTPGSRSKALYGFSLTARKMIHFVVFA